MAVYDTNSGFRFKMLKNSSVNLRINFKGTLKIKTIKNNYTLFVDEYDNIVAILQPPLLLDDSKVIKYKVAEIENNSFDIRIDIDEIANADIEFSFDWYMKKSILDSEVSIGKNNSYLLNYACISGNKSNISFLLLRFDFINIRLLDINKIEKVRFVVKSLSENIENELILTEVKEDWCSWTVDWKSQPKLDENEIKGECTKNGYIEFDITEYIKNCLKNKGCKGERYGLALLNKSNANAYIYTSDDSLYMPYLRVDLKN